MKKVTILTNEIDCESHSTYRTRIEKYLRINNIEVRDDFNVDMVIISTCGVTTKLFNMVVSVLESLKVKGFEATQIFIMGCLTKTHEEKLREVTKAWIVPFGNEKILDDFIQATTKFECIKPGNLISIPQKRHLTKETDYFSIEIEEGCLSQCTFCVINRAHGKIKSKNKLDLERQYNQAMLRKFNKISLYGTDTFAYGYDTGTDIIQLINGFNRINENVKYKLGTAHIRWIPQLYEGLKEIMGQITLMHPAIQHVDDTVLRRMGRIGGIEKEYDYLLRLKEYNPNVIYITDVIVGFPGESQEAFEKLLMFFEKDKCFDFVNVFMYDDMEAAPSYKLDNKISTAQKIIRYNHLNQVLKNKKSYDEEIHFSNLKNTVIVDGVFHCSNTCCD